MTGQSPSTASTASTPNTASTASTPNTPNTASTASTASLSTGDLSASGLSSSSAHAAGGQPHGSAMQSAGPAVQQWRSQPHKPIASWLSDMDGVLVHEGYAIPGAAEFVDTLHAQGRPFLLLTNNSMYTAQDLQRRLASIGIRVPANNIWTSALATAQFVSAQVPGGTAFAIGESGLTSALDEVGYTLTEFDPDYVILGETRTYSFEAITKAIRLINAGARFIVTNPDVTGPSLEGPLPATGAVASLIEAATGRSPYFVGKPNPILFRSALNKLGAHSETTAMIGDRMDTDVVGGIEAGMRTFLVLTGSTSPEMVETFPYRPSMVVDSIKDLVDLISWSKDEI